MKSFNWSLQGLAESPGTDPASWGEKPDDMPCHLVMSRGVSRGNVTW